MANNFENMHYLKVANMLEIFYFSNNKQTKIYNKNCQPKNTLLLIAIFSKSSDVKSSFISSYKLLLSKRV